MNILLGTEQQEFIEMQLASGAYASTDALINDAIALLAARHRKLAELKEAIAIGTEQIQNGQVTDGEVVFERLQAKYGYLSETDG